MAPANNLTWSFSTLGCPELSLEEVVDLAGLNGITRLELRTLEQRVDLPRLLNERYETPVALREYLDRAEIQISSLDTSLKLVGCSGEDRADFLEFVPWAEALGIRNLRVFDGGTFASGLSRQDLLACKETICWWNRMKEQEGWNTDIMVETHDCLTATRAIGQLQAELDTPLRILWDTHHTWKKAGENPASTWAELKEQIVHVHIKDSISVPSARHPFTYVMPGDGEFDLEGTVRMLDREDFRGCVSLEWERQWHPYLPPLADALSRAHELGWF